MTEGCVVRMSCDPVPVLALLAELGYEARPVTREDEIDRLTSVVEQSTKALASAIGALERIKSGSLAGKS